MQQKENSGSVLKQVDWFTVILYLILVMAGMVSIYAASYDFDHANMLSFTEFSGKQFRWIGLSLVLGLVLLLIDVRVYENYAYVIYGTVLLLLLITIFIAPNTKGSHSWLVLGPMSLQPAEFGKFSTALCLAKLFSSYNFVLNASRKNYMLALMIIFMPVILILAQNETGSALVYLSLFFVLYREGMSGLVLLAALCAVTFFVVAVKFTGSMLLGIPSGQAAVFIMIMVLIVAMLAVYCKEFTAARNVFSGLQAPASQSPCLRYAGWKFRVQSFHSCDHGGPGLLRAADVQNHSPQTCHNSGDSPVRHCISVFRELCLHFHPPAPPADENQGGTWHGRRSPWSRL